MSKKIINLKEKLDSIPQGERFDLITKTVESFIRDILDIPEDELIETSLAFNDIGLDSITAVKLKDMINESLAGSVEVIATDVFDHPTIEKFSQFIEGKMQGGSLTSQTKKEVPSDKDTKITEGIANLDNDEVVRRLQEKLKGETKKDDHTPQ